MCGLFLSYNFEVASAPERHLQKLMLRRGPDEFNCHRIKNEYGAYFAAHSRLSITGINAAMAQPIFEDNKLFLFNGEIYNYKQLIERYSLGSKTQSDTNVFFKLIRQLGLKKTIEIIDGMFAFILCDFTTNKIFFGRDHFGQKPLYYFQNNGSLALFSEPEYLSILDVKLKLNEEYLIKILGHGYKVRMLSDENELQGLLSASPNHIYEFCVNSNVIKSCELAHRFEHFKMQNQDDEFAFFNSTLSDIYPREVKFALPLSAGVDSNYILENIMHSGNIENFGGLYTVSGKNPKYSEIDYLINTIEFCNSHGIQHTVIVPPSGFEALDFITQMVQQRKGFVSGLNYVGQNIMYRKMAQDGIKVSISGVGADEIFSGYYDHYNFYYADHPTAKLKKSWEADIQPIVRNPWLKDLEIFKKQPNFRHHLLETAYEFEGLFKSFPEFPKLPEDSNESLLRRRMKSELQREIVPVVLRDDDFNSMFHGIESRAAYLQERIYDYACDIPETNFFSTGLAKSTLRTFGARLNSSNEAFSRKRKIGFNLSIWDLIGSEKLMFRDLVLGSTYIQRNFNTEYLNELILSENDDNYFSKLYFGLINLAILEGGL